MAVGDSTRITVLLSLSVLLTVCQVITAIVLIMLFRAFLNLRKKVLEYEKHLPLVRLETSQPKETLAPAKRRSGKLSKATALSLRWHKDGEVPTRVPSPPANRRSVEVPVEDCTMAIPRTISTSGQKLLESSFASFNSPRDSGTGSTSTRSTQGSISFDETLITTRESFSKREEGSALSKRMSRGSEGSKTQRDPSCDPPFESGRTSSSVSCGPHPRSTRYPSYGCHSLRIRNEPLSNENSLGISRLKTMAIEMVGLDEVPGESKARRASRLLKEMREAEEPSVIEDVGLENIGYHGDHDASNRSSSEFSKRVTLASEESVSSLNSESVHMELNNNEVKNLDYEEEDYVNQEVIDAVRLNSIASRTECNDEYEEPLFINTVE